MIRVLLRHSQTRSCRSCSQSGLTRHASGRYADHHTSQFLSQAKRLANEHNNRGEITVEVVTTEQVYNEFSSGTPDATAYRWVLKMLYDRANESGDLTKRPGFLLLFGRGSYDNRKILRSSGEPFVLTYQAENSLVETESYVTDDYFAFLKDTDGDNVPAHSLDIGVGRFPVSTLQEATDVVTKTINYMKDENRGIWKNQLCFLADDGDDALHAKQAEVVALSVAANNPAFQITKIYLDAYQQIINASGETYPVARTQFHNLLRNGMFVLNFTGHAGTAGWTNEQILTTTDVRTLSNKNLPLWVAVTCNFYNLICRLFQPVNGVVKSGWWWCRYFLGYPSGICFTEFEYQQRG